MKDYIEVDTILQTDVRAHNSHKTICRGFISYSKLVVVLHVKLSSVSYFFSYLKTNQTH